MLSQRKQGRCARFQASSPSNVSLAHAYGGALPFLGAEKNIQENPMHEEIYNEGSQEPGFTNSVGRRRSSSSRLISSSAPSAPLMPDNAFDGELIKHPSIHSSPPNISVPNIDHYGPSITSDAEYGINSSSCIICWEAPVESVCVPCGHMAGCFACLSEIKNKDGVCPVCRANITQVMKLYAV